MEMEREMGCGGLEKQEEKAEEAGEKRSRSRH